MNDKLKQEALDIRLDAAARPPKKFVRLPKRMRSLAAMHADRKHRKQASKD